ncbi:lipopolysaccharide export system ATP-binding protein LptB [Anaerotignum neopropionicum]|uniref:Lipopolysaccharide export system ATP-binding protein LptB n=1 Tax=Anaerotignum neopropionicum TaxID=36847 RepID=A0A136WD58_9FIRM|nr:ABC transporter ATP-binding protein [Anaerotignum neopropionicum]KXL52420.1 lipopolysaccharide export system ATP-binding protein LptB [Anaerotignum neopropionicum]
MSLLSVKNLTIRFGGLLAVNDFNLEIGEQELYGLIGPNGAGKTTVFNMLTGVYTPTGGSITFDGERIDGIKPYNITAKHIARTFQNIRLFGNLTVLQNVMMGYDYQAKSGLFSSIIRTPKQIKEEEKMHEDAMKLLTIFHMEDLAEEKAKNLPYGQQRRLEIARALAANPKLLLLDEPAAGMNPQETAELTELIRWIRDEFKISILLIEHDMKLVMNVCEKITVLSFGQLLAAGKPEEIRNNPRVIEAYLGKRGA